MLQNSQNTYRAFSERKYKDQPRAQQKKGLLRASNPFLIALLRTQRLTLDGKIIPVHGHVLPAAEREHLRKPGAILQNTNASQMQRRRLSRSGRSSWARP